MDQKREGTVDIVGRSRRDQAGLSSSTGVGERELCLPGTPYAYKRELWVSYIPRKSRCVATEFG